MFYLFVYECLYSVYMFNMFIPGMHGRFYGLDMETTPETTEIGIHICSRDNFFSHSSVLIPLTPTCCLLCVLMICEISHRDIFLEDLPKRQRSPKNCTPQTVAGIIRKCLVYRCPNLVFSLPKDLTVI